MIVQDVDGTLKSELHGVTLIRVSDKIVRVVSKDKVKFKSDLDQRKTTMESYNAKPLQSA